MEVSLRVARSCRYAVVLSRRSVRTGTARTPIVCDASPRSAIPARYPVRREEFGIYRRTRVMAAAAPHATVGPANTGWSLAST